MSVDKLIIENLALWTGAVTPKSSSGRGSNGKLEMTGIKKLRELILELAVWGKLVPQVEEDGSAEDLLSLAQDRKSALLNAKAIRRSKAPALYEGDADLKLPKSWVRTTLYELGIIGPRNELHNAQSAAFVPMEKISERYGVAVEHEIKAWGEIKSGFTHFQENDVVLAKITPCFQNGKSCVMTGLKNGVGAGTTELHVFRSIPDTVDPKFVLLFLKSPGFIQEGIPRMTGTAGQKRITRDYFAGKPFPLPPMAEQCRIVAKVDELMALCDQLEQQQTSSLQAHQTLVETLLRTLVEAGDADNTRQAWNRIAEHFHILFITEESIDQLKQCVLQLAVMGRLVPQGTDDEPATVFLRKIAARKNRLYKEGKIRRPKNFSEIQADEMPFPLRQGWEWSRLGDFSVVGTGSTPSRDNLAYYDPPTINWVTSGETEAEYIFETKEKISSKALEETSISVYPAGALVVAMYGQGRTRGQISELMIDAGTNQACAAISLICEALEHRKYIKLFFKKSYEELRMHAAGGAQPNLNVRKVSQMVVPMPPLDEQRRIVAKVEELTALCDALKVRIQQAQITQAHLADAIVEQAVA